MNEKPAHPLESLFYPKNIAVVGASPKGGLAGGRWGGNTYIEGSIQLHFKGKIFPVHPTAENILGFTAYKSVREIPAEVDLVIFSVPSKVVLEVMGDCVAKGVKYVHLFTAGFSETGREDLARLEQDMIRMARQAGIRVIGPNCMGLYCPEGGLAWTNEFPSNPGPIGLVSQSGQLAGMFISMAAGKGLRFSKVVSYGNAGDLQNHEFLEYLAQDDKTKFIGSYVEGLKDGRAFFEQAKKITPVKPMVVFKGGMTEGGSRATQSHTASLAGSPELWKAICRQAGLISVSSLEDMTATLAALMHLPLPRGTNVAVLGGAGGGSVTMTDMAEVAGLRVPHLTDKTVKAIEEFVPIQGSSAKNPLDIMGAFFGQGYAKPPVAHGFASRRSEHRRPYLQSAGGPHLPCGGEFHDFPPSSVDQGFHGSYGQADLCGAGQGPRGTGRRDPQAGVGRPIYQCRFRHLLPPSPRRPGSWPSWISIDGTWRRSGGRPRVASKDKR